MSLKTFWDNVTFLGLDERDEFKHKEVVLMNKLIFISALLMTALIPLEVLINGWELVYLEGIVIALCLSALTFNYLRWFAFAKFYFFVIASSIVFSFGLMIGSGTGNELFFIPIFIFPAMLFHDRRIILTLSALALIFFLVLNYLQTVFEPTLYVKPEIKKTIRFIFYTICFLIVYFEIYYFKTINYRFQKLLATKNQEIEHKNQEIIDSITYAKRIQEAILLPLNLVKNHLPDSFVLFKPKDIVAGDFYWVEEVDDKIIFAAADCTGHGVPGAMVSVVCHNALNSAVHQYDLISPGKILDKTRELVIQQFSKSTEDVKDGMDISLCVLNKKTLQLEFAGANNPLWLLRKNDNEIFEIKSTKQAVGKGDLSKPFETHTIQLSPGDLIYIFSDGFADQFGGEKGKKYKYKPFKDLLVLNRNKTLEAQSQVINAEFEKWRQDLEQVDDICVIGVRA